MAAKPADLGRSCVLFETFGKCIYGVTCRFAQAHLGDGYQNVVNTDLAKQWEGKSLVRNNLSKDLQHQLRKRKFSFRKADEYLRGLAKPHGSGGKGDKATGCSTEEQEVSNCTAPHEGLGDSPQCSVLPEPGEDPKPDALQSPGPTGSEEASAIKTAGSVTDEDTIKLRAREKKKVRVRSRAAISCVPVKWLRLCLGRQKRPLSWVRGRQRTELPGDRVTVVRGRMQEGELLGPWFCPWRGEKQEKLQPLAREEG